MLNFWVLAYVAAIYIRPGEIVPSMAEVPLLNYLSALAGLAIVISLALKPRAFWDRPQDKMLLVYYLAIALSNPVNGWLGGGILGLTTFVPVVFGYFLIRLGVQTEEQLQWFIRLFVALNVFLAVNGLFQVFFGAGFGQVEAMETSDGIRIMGTGIFNDPNDLGMTLVMALPFVIRTIVGADRRLITRLVGVALLVVLGAACFYTNSRGTMLGLGVVFLWFVYRRYGTAAAGVLGVLGFVALLALGPSRMSELSADEDSAQGRIQSWSEGLQMFRSEPVLGVGFRQYSDYHTMVAHNAFVHVLAELGIVGAVAFVGIFFWHFQTIRALRRDRLKRATLPDDIIASTLGMITCVMFLSRQYVIVTFLPVALGACLAAAVGTSSEAEGSRPAQGAVVVLTTCGLVVFFYVVVRLFASFGG